MDDRLAPPAPMPTGPSWRTVLIVVVLATVGTGAVVGFLVRDRSDDGDPPSRTYAVATAGMEPTLGEGDRVAARDIDGSEVGRGDVIVLEAPASDDRGSTLIVKRVIGLPGETIEASDGVVSVDGRLLDEPYLLDNVATNELPPTEVPEGHVFVMGDNRTNSSDSRVFGPVQFQDIVALVELT